MDKLWNIINNEEFLKDLIKIEDYINEHYKELEERYQIKNKLQKAAERLLYFYMHKKLNIDKIYPSPISSDLAFFTKDCLINIDAKTIDLDGNEGDDHYVQFGPHQISFFNNPFFNRKIKDILFSGIVMPPGLPELDSKEKLPCLTFFLGITYRDNRSSFTIERMKLSCIPNGIVAKEDFSNNLITNFKTYSYLKVDEAQRIDAKYLPKPLTFQIPSNWIPFNLKDNNGQDDTWLDLNLKNPYDKSKFAIWRILNKQYHICLGGGTARIEPELIRNRKDDEGNNWLGVRSAVIDTKNKKIIIDK